MISTGKIIKIKSAPHYKFHKWWVDVKVQTFNRQEFETSVAEDTKLKVLEHAQINKFVVFAH